MSLLSDDIYNTFEDETSKEINQYELKTEELVENNPFQINDKLAQNGFVATYDAVYRLYTVDDDGNEYYLKISRESGKKFQLNYSWCIKQDGEYSVISSRCTSNLIINDGEKNRNKILGQCAKQSNLPRYKGAIKEFLNETWQLIYKATDCLKILKDKEIEYNPNKYSKANIIGEYITLSDVVIDDGIEFRLLHVKTECYKLFAHNTDSDDESLIAVFNWQDEPDMILKADKFDDRIQLFVEKITNYHPNHDGIKIKDDLFKSLVKLQVDMNNKMKVIGNASSIITDEINDAVSTLTNKFSDNIKQLINEKLMEHKAPSVQSLSDYLNLSGEFFVVHNIKKRFKKTPYGFNEIKPKDISNFFNEHFGFNKISMKNCNKCIDYITRELTIDYDLVQFKNGLYNTKSGKFSENKFATNYIPKINLDNFNYVPDAKEKFMATDLYKENHEILKSDVWDWNEDIFYKSVGSCYHANNVADKLFIIVGLPDSRKSTLLTIIKRIFNNNYSTLKIQTIVENQRFTLAPCINKSVNIDDDASDLQLKNIGALNTFVSGTGISVELKNQNETVLLDEFNTPRIWCASNELFSVIGSGFDRRLCLILCENTFDKNSSSKEYMLDIKNGLRDEELSLLISYSLQLYEKERTKSFLSSEQSDAMREEFEFKSYPERKFVKECFLYGDEIASYLQNEYVKPRVNVPKNYVEKTWSDISEYYKKMIIFPSNVCINNDKDSKINNGNDSKSDNYLEIGKKSKVVAVDMDKWKITIEFTDNTDEKKFIKGIIPTFITRNDAVILCRKYLRYQYDRGRIFKNQSTSSGKRTKTAMEGFGYIQENKNYKTNGNRTSTNVFENAVVNPYWLEKLEIDYLYEITVKDYIIGT